MMAVKYLASASYVHVAHNCKLCLAESLPSTRRQVIFIVSTCAPLFSLSNIPAPFSASASSSSSSSSSRSEFLELPNSGGVKALDLRIGSGEIPVDGDQVAIHYYGRLAAKQGWRFDSTYDHKDNTGEPTPFVFVLGSGRVISGIEVAVKSMKVGGIRRIIIPPSQGYRNTTQEPLPPNAEAIYNYFQSNSSGKWRRLNIGHVDIRH